MLTAEQINGDILYEDAVCFAYLPKDAAALGHIQVIAKEAYPTLEDCPDDIAVQLFYVASYAATAVYEGLGAHGTNIICNNGKGAGGSSFVIDVLPRKEDDGLDMKWEAKPQQPDALDSTASKIKDKADILAAKGDSSSHDSSAAPAPTGSQPPPGAPPTAPAVAAQPPESIPVKEEENYMVKHLYRVP